MKRTINLVSILVILVIGIAASPLTPKQVTFKWLVNPADLGGLSTNDYYTNIAFNVLSVTNCTIPTNQWPVVVSWLASSFPSPDGVNWTNAITIDGNTRFYLIQAVNLNGGSAPFSSVATWVPVPPTGTQPRVSGP